MGGLARLALDRRRTFDVDRRGVDLSAEALRPRGSAGRRFLEYAVFVLVWIRLGLILSVGLVPFLLIGAALLVLFQLARRQPLRRLWARDADYLRPQIGGKLLVAAVLIVIPTVMLLQSLRLDRYANDSWTALVLGLAFLAGGYLASRRLVLTVAVAALAVLVMSWMLTPDLATARDGDPAVLAHLDEAQHGLVERISATSPSPRSTWTRRIRCAWPVSVLQPRHQWKSDR